MKRIFRYTRMIVFVAMNGCLSAASTFAVDKHLPSIPKTTTQEESVLNFKIEDRVERTRSADCAAAKQMERDRKQLDPQLSAADKSRYADLIGPDACQETHSTLPAKK